MECPSSKGARGSVSSADGAVLPGVITRRNRNGDLASRSATILTKNEIVIKLGPILKVGKRV